MQILTRYVLREYLVPFIYCLTGFLGIYVIFELFESFNRLMEAKPPFTTIVAFFAGYVSPYLEWLLPAALMLAALYTMWNFCRHSEITAMRANGIGFIAIVKPLLAVALITAAAVALINEFYAPAASEYARTLREGRFKPMQAELRKNINYINQSNGTVWRINTMNLENPGVLEGVRISFDRPDGSRLVDITCRRAEYLDGMWWLFYPQYNYFDELNSPAPNPMPQLKSLVIRSMPDLTETPHDFILMNKAWEYYSIRDMLRYLQTHPGIDTAESASRRYDIYARIAAPFSCLVIILFAIPAGVASSRQSVFVGVIMAVAMFFGFYASAIGCMILAKNNMIPPLLGAWLPNLIFLTIGAVLFYRQR